MDMNKPLFPAPPGYVVNLSDPQRTGEAANLWVGAVGMSIAAFFMAVRIYTKTRFAKRFSADDMALIVAWFFSVAIQVIILVQYRGGTLGVHIWELSGNRVNFSLNLVNVASILYCPFLASAKLSLLLLYLRLSPLRWFRICVYGGMFIVIGYSIALLFPLIFACTPFKRNWDITITEGSCINRTPLYMATAVLNMVTDILLLILPIPMVVKLQVPRAQKAGLLCIFGVGSLTCITSGVRLALLFPMLTTIDQTWAIVMPGIWILIEANLIIITGCLPAMRLFLRHVAPRVIGESSFNSRKQTRGYTTDSHGAHSELQTIGSKHMNRAYNQMEDDGVSVGSDERAAAGWQGDGSSERSIVASPSGITKTQSFAVNSEICDNGSSNQGRTSACGIHAL